MKVQSLGGVLRAMVAFIFKGGKTQKTLHASFTSKCRFHLRPSVDFYSIPVENSDHFSEAKTAAISEAFEAEQLCKLLNHL